MEWSATDETGAFQLCLHSTLIELMTDFIAQVPRETQILIVTHSQALAASGDAKKTELVSHDGETRLKGIAVAKHALSFG